MGIWDNIKNYFYQQELRIPNGNSAKRSIINFADAHTVGIVFDSSKPDNDRTIHLFAEMLKSKNKEVHLLGYVDDNKTEHKEGISVFNKKAVNWYNIPSDKEVTTFINKPFDLLLTALVEPNAALEYIAFQSKAKYRVGVYGRNKTQFYDLMIDTGGKKDLGYLLDQITHFLNQIQYDKK